MPTSSKQQQNLSRWGGAPTAASPVCPVHATVNLLGGKWKLLILATLLEGVHRYGDLRRRLPGITEKMLVQELRELEADGLVARTAHPQVPPRVEYALVGHGEQLRPALEALLGWGRSYLAQPPVELHSSENIASRNS